jgi:hypothetical protein
MIAHGRHDEDRASATLLRDALRAHEKGKDFRLHWMTLGAAGIRKDDRIFVSPALTSVIGTISSLGIERLPMKKEATMLVVHRPTNNELLSMMNRLEPNVRLVVYSDEKDLDCMSEKTFDLATACIFDQESRKTVRIYDRPCKIESYISIELADITDSAMSMQAARIATLR